MRRSLFTLLFLVFFPLLVAQQAADQAIDKGAVVKLEKSGVSDAVIIEMINTSPCSFDTSPDGIIALKNAGVHDDVVMAIINRINHLEHPPAMHSTGSASAQYDTDDPMARHEAGVYLMTDSPTGKKMVFIDRVGESALRTSNMAGAAFSFGAAKMKLKAEIPGPHAEARTTEKRPVFYMYFPDFSSFGAFAGVNLVTSPNQFSLLRLDEQKGRRETDIAKVGIAGGRIGADQQKIALFSSDRIRARVYKITPSSDLKPGEYAFVAAMPGLTPETQPSVVIYDFGVDPK